MNVKSKQLENPLLQLTETELRDLCRHRIDSLEQWSRRLIDETFKETYKENYFNVEVQPGQPLIKSEIKKRITERMEKEPRRYPRLIDAILMEDLDYFFCRDDLYEEHFKNIFEPFFSRQEEVRSVIKRLIPIRNKLSHGNTISLHEAEQTLCYVGDFIDCFKKHYEVKGKTREYNVPIFFRVKESLGNDIIRSKKEMEYYPWSVYYITKANDYNPCGMFRSGDTIKICIEVDSSFPEDSYDIYWEYECGKKNKNGNGTIFKITFDDYDVSYRPNIHFYLKTHNTWHRNARQDYDDKIEISLGEVFPPIESTY